MRPLVVDAIARCAIGATSPGRSAAEIAGDATGLQASKRPRQYLFVRVRDHRIVLVSGRVATGTAPPLRLAEEPLLCGSVRADRQAESGR